MEKEEKGEGPEPKVDLKIRGGGQDHAQGVRGEIQLEAEADGDRQDPGEAPRVCEDCREV